MSAAASSASAPAAAKWNVMQRTYRQLRRFNETEAFLRHCISVHTPETCGKYATYMLRQHRKVATIIAERRGVAVYRLDRKVSLWAAKRAALGRLYAHHARLQVLNLISDVLVLITFGFAMWVVVGSFNLVRVALHRIEMMERMSATIFNTAEALENSGRDRLEKEEEDKMSKRW